MIIYTDGSAHPNPGPGGYGVVVCDDDGQFIKCYSHQENNTTNNIQELKAIIYATACYGKNYGEVTVYSDSAYAVNTLTSWMFGWQRNNWLKSDNKVPENLELIQAYYDLWSKGYKINLVKVKGHAGIQENEVADRLATGRWTTQDAYNFYERK